jgi:hypothetical protein
MKLNALVTGMVALAFMATAVADGPKQAQTPKVNKAGKKGTVPNKGEPGETKKTLKNPAHHEAQAKSNKTLFHAFNVLQSTKVMLQKADHDYGGHRMNAIQSIGVAQAQLRLALGKYGKNIPPAAPGKDGAGKEAQKKSNAQLNQAIRTVRGTISHLANANHDYYGHRHNAVQALQGTMQHLQLATQFVRSK